MNPYEVLQISPSASLEEARDAYHSLAKKWHPDKFSGAEKQAAEDKFRRIAEAYSSIKKGTASTQPASGASASASAPAAKPSQREKSPADWLSDAKKALAYKQFDAAIATSQYCFNYQQVAEDAKLVYAKAVEATTGDVKAQARAYEEVVHINANNLEAVSRLAELYLSLNMPTRAASMAERAKKLGASVKTGRAQAPSGEAGASDQETGGFVNKLAGLFKSGTKRG